MDSHLAAKRLVDDGRVVLLGASKRQVQRVEQPRQELHGVALLRDLELLLGDQHDGLEHLVRAHVGLEVPGVPELANQLSESADQLEADVSGTASDAAVIGLLQGPSLPRNAPLERQQ